MPEINLPDGSVRSYSNSVSVADVAQDIGEGSQELRLLE